MTRNLAVTAVLFTAVAGCADQATIEGRTCPCSDGYTCCATNTCVPEGTACSVVEPVTLDRSARPCSSDDDLGNDGSIDVHWTWGYDSEGNDVHDEGDHGLDGSIDDIFTQRFDASHQFTLVSEVLEGTEIYHEERTFDELERLSQDLFDNGDGTMMTQVWSYDGMTAVCDTDYETDGVVDSREVFSQNAAGKPVSSTLSNGDGTLAQTRTWMYSVTGNLLQSIRFSPDGSVFRTTTYEYDNAGRMLHRTTSDATGTPQIDVANTFDDDGRFDTQTITGTGIDPDYKTTMHYSCH